MCYCDWFRYNWSWPSSKIVAASVVIGMEAVSFVMGLLRVVGNRPIKKMSLKIEKQANIAMSAVSALSTISSLISKALSVHSISDEEFSLILLKSERFTWRKEELRIQSRNSLDKTGNIETGPSVLFNRKKKTIPNQTHAQIRVQNHVQNYVKICVQNNVKNHV